jgi:hypothetical protein
MRLGMHGYCYALALDAAGSRAPTMGQHLYTHDRSSQTFSLFYWGFAGIMNVFKVKPLEQKDRKKECRRWMNGPGLRVMIPAYPAP